jgi:hypothetical protein
MQRHFRIKDHIEAGAGAFPAPVWFMPGLEAAAAGLYYLACGARGPNSPALPAGPNRTAGGHLFGPPAVCFKGRRAKKGCGGRLKGFAGLGSGLAAVLLGLLGLRGAGFVAIQIFLNSPVDHFRTIAALGFGNSVQAFQQLRVDARADQRASGFLCHDNHHGSLAEIRNKYNTCNTYTNGIHLYYGPSLARSAGIAAAIARGNEMALPQDEARPRLKFHPGDANPDVEFVNRMFANPITGSMLARKVAAALRGLEDGPLSYQDRLFDALSRVDDPEGDARTLLESLLANRAELSPLRLAGREA